MKNKKQWLETKSGKWKPINTKEVTGYVDGVRSHVTSQVKFQEFDTIKSPQIVYLWVHYWSKYSNGLPTFDIDGAGTTIMEMLQPKSISRMSIHLPGVYENDRQVRMSLITEEEVPSKKLERARVVVWMSEKNIVLDIGDVMDYTRLRPVNPEYEAYDDLPGLLDSL